MDNLARKSAIGLMQLIIGLGFMLFVPTWSFDYWQAWVYIFIFGTSAGLIFAYLYKNDPKLLVRRMERTEKEKSQKWIQFYIFILYVCMFFLASLDHRFLWSEVSFSVVMIGDVLVAFGYLIILIVLKENTFAASTIIVAAEHKVISTGPYSLIRHPMYLGAIIIMSGTPLALGSWWGLLIIIPFVAIIVWRLIEEEKFLDLTLSGYTEYCQKTRYRLVPFIW